MLRLAIPAQLLALGATRPVDPTLDAALRAVEFALVRSDPKITKTTQLIRDIVTAPPMTSGGGGGGKSGKLSDLNPLLAKVSFIRNKPVETAAIGIGISAFLFFAGFVLAKVSRAKKANTAVAEGAS